MKQLSIHTVCVCGAGTMGRGIAQVIAQNKFDTILYDLDQAAVTNAREMIDRNMQRLVDKGKMTNEERIAVLSRLHFVSDINECKADIVIEAIVENLQAKINLFNELSAFNKKTTILATNTSSLSVSDIAAGVANPERVIGLHFFNPAIIMKLVEVVQGVETSEQVVQGAFSFIHSMNKTPVLCKDVPGFIVNRVARPYYLVALRLVEAGIVEIKTIDLLLESTGFKMGPFKLMDLIGNDINFAVSQSLYQQLGRPARLEPSLLQQEKVNLGNLGRKTGKGYYDYPTE